MTEQCWAEVTVETPPEWVEIAAAALNALGANGVLILGSPPGEADGDWAWPAEVGPSGVRAYFATDDLLGERLRLLRSRLADAALHVGSPPFDVSLRQAIGADWAEAWKSHYHPIRIGKVTVVPRWEEYESSPGETAIRLDPGLAFGAGTHPTTQQSLLLLQDELHPGDRVLDIGTGSGILAIAAALLGAGSVLARDVDGTATAVACENVATNGLSGRVIVEQGDLATNLTGRYDLVLANLVAPLLLDLLPALPHHLAPGARVIMAGIISNRAQEVGSAAVAAALGLTRETREGEWVALVGVAAEASRPD